MPTFIHPKHTYQIAPFAALLLSFCLNTTMVKAQDHSPETPVIKTEWVKIMRSETKSGKKVVTEMETVSVSGITFETSVDNGLKMAHEKNKPLLVFLKKDGCPHCAAFEKNTLSAPAVEKYLADNFVCSRVLSGSKDEQVLKHDFGCNAFPHFVVFDGNGKLIGRWYGQPQSADEFIAKAKAASLVK
jgi:thiol:disulfide interchange protein